MKIKIILIFSLCFLYSFLRYNIFGNIPFFEIPTVIINKSVSFATVILLLFSSRSIIDKKIDEYNFYIQIFKISIYIHVFLSLSILSQSYFPKLFIDNKLNFLGNLLVLSGVINVAIISAKKFKFSNIYLLIFLAIHLFVMGYQGWFAPSSWFGYIPPITLISFLLIFLNLFLLIKNRKLIEL